MVDKAVFDNQVEPAWCPGCGNFPILNALKQALADLDLEPHRVLVVSGIGQSSKLPDYIRTNAFTSLHGRPIPIAQAAHLGNHDLKVVVVAGDGDTYGLGGNHLIHYMRRNVDISVMVHDNRIYGLTKGQYSPTSPPGFVSKTSPPPEGAIDRPVNPIALALAAQATFVARSWSGDPAHLAETMAAAVSHRGASFLDILQPCVVFNRNYSYDYFRERVYKLEEEVGYDPADLESAWRKAQESDDNIAIGIIYRAEGLPTYEEQVPALKSGPLAEREFRDWTEEDHKELEAEFL
jgi:2-oxoglutarate ferredoxin oxidoreductase subunit beta